AIDPVPLKREAALKLGATHAVDPGSSDPVEQVRDLTGGLGSDITFETAGRNDTADWAVLAARRGGTIVCVGAASRACQCPRSMRRRSSGRCTDTRTRAATSQGSWAWSSGGCSTSTRW